MNTHFLNRLFALKKHTGNVLVCETDGFTLRGAVINSNGKQLSVLHSTISYEQDLKNALKEVLIVLKMQGWQVGGSAILLTPSVVSTLIDLPVTSNKPRPRTQMHELVRQEIEYLLTQHVTIWSIGRILVGYGYLKEAQAREILSIQHERAKSADVKSAMYSLKRFGDLAIEYQYITQAQLNEALQKQAWLRVDSEDIVCGWQIASQQANEDHTYRWLVSGLSAEILQFWKQAFLEHAIKLELLFPMAGCATTHIHTTQSTLLLEAGGGQFLGTRLSGSGIEAMVSKESALNGNLEACLECYHGLVPPEVEQVWLSADQSCDTNMLQLLTDIIGRPVQTLKVQALGSLEFVSVGMLGAARQLFALQGSRYCTPVPTEGPKKPFYQLPEFRLAAAAALMLLMLGLAEGYYQYQFSKVRAHAREVEAKNVEREEFVGKIQALVKQEADIKAKNDESEKIIKRLSFYDDELTTRKAILNSFLKELERSLNEQTVIDSVVEQAKIGIVVSGWSVSDSAAQQFINTFKNNLAPLQLTLVDSRVSERIGRLSLSGYAVSFRVVDQVSAKKPADKDPKKQ